MAISGTDHVQLAMPRGEEAAAIAFYEGLLGIPSVAKPPNLAANGGCWFERGDTTLHLGVDPDFRPARTAHPALLVADIGALTDALRAGGVAVRDGEPIAGYRRVFVADPFGNRLELMQRATVEPDAAEPGARAQADVASTRAVYDHSVDRYVDAVGTTVSDRFEAPLDQALLAAFAESVAGRGSRRVLDVGCGPGRVAGRLAELGLDTSGVDLSPRMVEAARAAHPRLRFDVGLLTELPVEDGSISGAVYWYSIIATPSSGLCAVWNELDRVLAGDGVALIAFQSGRGESVERPDAHGSGSTLTLYRHSPDDVVASLARAGFSLHADVRRQPVFDHETTPQAFMLVERERPQAT